MVSGLFLIGSGGVRWGDSLSPETLAHKHPLWAEEVSAFAPWVKLEETPPGSGEPHLLWKGTTEASEETVMVFGRCPSSMDVAWAFDNVNPLPDWSSILAVEQISGRGRWQRPWVSPPGNLYVTWVWPKDLERYVPVGSTPGMLSLVVGFILAFALRAKNLDVQIKWPNDLFWKGQKIGGILIEQKKDRVLVGIGLNLASAPPREALKREGAPPAISLAQAGLVMSPLSGWKELSRLARICLDEQVRCLSSGEFVPLLEEHLVGIGQTVMVQTGQDEPYEAKMVGLAEDGGLVLEKRGGQSVLYSGTLLFI